MADIALYSGLFGNAFIAATLLPAFSEIALAALLQSNTGAPFLLFIAATTGNIAGAIVNWWLGKGIARFQHKRWFPFKETAVEAAKRHFNRFGKWSLLMAWLPIVGDPLTLVAGVLKTPFPIFLLLVSIGKAMRYGMIIGAFYYIG
ncbi:MAG: DedA family protein [Kordiimonadaceae bacterium]|nr:DedA family protein [Kordiimonadaceae bacterium]